jgi:hypothetical protein
MDVSKVLLLLCIASALLVSRLDAPLFISQNDWPHPIMLCFVENFTSLFMYITSLVLDRMVKHKWPHAFYVTKAEELIICKGSSSIDSKMFTEINKPT